jgi:hypothetical protein
MATHLKVLFFLQDITTTFFMFALVAAVKNVASCGMGGCCDGGSCSCEVGMCACGDKDCDGSCMMPKKMMKEMPMKETSSSMKKPAPRRRVASKE